MKISIYTNFYILLYTKMKNLLIIYWKNRNYNWIDFMYIWKTRKETKETFNNRLEFQKQKIENSWFNYRSVIHELKYWKTN